MSFADELRDLSNNIDPFYKLKQIIQTIKDRAKEEARLGKTFLFINNFQNQDLQKILIKIEHDDMLKIINVLENEENKLNVKSNHRDWEYPMDTFGISWSN